MNAVGIQRILVSSLKSGDETDPIQLAPGQVINVVLKETQGDTALLTYQGKTFAARMETEVPAGQRLKCLVEGEIDGQVVLKVLNGNQEGITGQDVKNLLRSLGLPEDSINVKLLTEMVKQEMPLTPETVRLLSVFTKALNIPDKEMWIPVFMQKQDIAMNEQMFRSIRELLTDIGYLQSDISRLSSELQKIVDREGPGAELKSLASELKLALQNLQVNGDEGSLSIAQKLAGFIRMLAVQPTQMLLTGKQAAARITPVDDFSPQGLSAQIQAGQLTGGQAAPEQVIARQTEPGHIADGQETTGQAVTGQAVTGQAAAGQAATSQTVAGQAAAGQAATGQAATGQAVTGQVPPWQISAEGDLIFNQRRAAVITESSQIPQTAAGQTGAGKSESVSPSGEHPPAVVPLPEGILPETGLRAAETGSGAAETGSGAEETGRPAVHYRADGNAGSIEQRGIQKGQGEPNGSGHTLSDGTLKNLVNRLSDLVDKSGNIDMVQKDMILARMSKLLEQTGKESLPAPDILPMLAKFGTALANSSNKEFAELVQVTKNVMGKLEIIQNFNNRVESAKDNLMMVHTSVRFYDREEPLRLVINYRQAGKDKKPDFSSCRVEVKLNTPHLGLVKCGLQVHNRNLNMRFVTESELAGQRLDSDIEILISRLQEMNYLISLAPSQVIKEDEDAPVITEKQEPAGLFRINLKV